MMRFLKDWTLPIAMAAGAGGYFLFHYAGFLAPLKPAVWVAVDILTPSLIFIQLFLTFCKIDLKDLRLTKWHWIILACHSRCSRHGQTGWQCCAHYTL